MFISFFTGKVMLFYGISLIMKEKSNASALHSLCLSAHLAPDTPASGSSDIRISSQRRPNLAPATSASGSSDVCTRDGVRQKS